MDSGKEMYIGCKLCYNELEDGDSPREYARLEACINEAKDKLSISCVRHEEHIITLPLALAADAITH